MELVLSAAAGICARFICHPLDTIKTVAFTGFASEESATKHAGATANAFGAGGRQRKAFSSTFWSAAGDIYGREGVRGLYRGIGVTAVGAAPGVALYLTSYDHFSAYLRQRLDGARVPTGALYFLSGFAAEAVSCLVWVPIDVSKERLQSQPPSLHCRYRNSWDALRTIHTHEGIGGLYKGYFSTLGSFGPFSAIYFVGYEWLQHRLRCALTPSADAARGVATENANTTFLIAMLSGGCANVLASLCTNPLELVKTRLQVQQAVLRSAESPNAQVVVPRYSFQYKNFLDGLAHLAREEGVRGMWRGVWCRAAFTAPNAALTMAFYEYLKIYYL
ncbi:mitochondrial carrier protein [Strigomonas culicis]|uniref:Mitochondrial carrier protein n=1 Tax=Strigomonas culicis TaxID=28005 RepID=S9TRS7_9TRYP|nr:mitochondrial carrier protein [Strigomonas culicis]|eukprot:EPY19193.1 mitochondrial carrier protein [Strigomonas culicis]